MVLIILPRYHAKNFLIVSPFVYFLVYALIKIPSLAEIPSWTGRRELPIIQYGVLNLISNYDGVKGSTADSLLALVNFPKPSSMM